MKHCHVPRKRSAVYLGFGSVAVLFFLIFSGSQRRTELLPERRHLNVTIRGHDLVKPAGIDRASIHRHSDTKTSVLSSTGTVLSVSRIQLRQHSKTLDVSIRINAKGFDRNPSPINPCPNLQFSHRLETEGLKTLTIRHSRALDNYRARLSVNPRGSGLDNRSLESTILRSVSNFLQRPIYLKRTAEYVLSR